MAALSWDAAGSRTYEAGIDRGVLYLPDGTAVAWNGLTAVDEDAEESSQGFYLDGIKYADLPAPVDFQATLSVFTYPEEFVPFDGLAAMGNGLYVDNQRPETFNLSYRTRIGTDSDPDAGYKIHLLYNLTATPRDLNSATTTDQNQLEELSWKLNAVPERLTSYRPTAHAIIDTTKMNRFMLAELEETLYGTDSTAPELPDLQSLVDDMSVWELITVIDNGDGTWSATGPDELVYLTSATEWQIDEVDVTFGGSAPYATDTYTMSTTMP